MACMAAAPTPASKSSTYTKSWVTEESSPLVSEPKPVMNRYGSTRPITVLIAW